MSEFPGNVFPRKLDAPLPFAKHAHGIFIEDETGKKYMDASGGGVFL